MKMKNLLNAVVAISVFASIQAGAIEQKFESLAKHVIGDERIERLVAVVGASKKVANLADFGDRAITGDVTLNSRINLLTEGEAPTHDWRIATAEAYVHNVLNDEINIETRAENPDAWHHMKKLVIDSVAAKNVALVMAAGEIFGGNVEDFGEAFHKYREGVVGWSDLMIDMAIKGASFPDQSELQVAVKTMYDLKYAAPKVVEMPADAPAEKDDL